MRSRKSGDERLHILTATSSLLGPVLQLRGSSSTAVSGGGEREYDHELANPASFIRFSQVDEHVEEQLAAEKPVVSVPRECHSHTVDNPLFESLLSLKQAARYDSPIPRAMVSSSEKEMHPSGIIGLPREKKWFEESTSGEEAMDEEEEPQEREIESHGYSHVQSGDTKSPDALREINSLLNEITKGASSELAGDAHEDKDCSEQEEVEQKNNKVATKSVIRPMSKPKGAVRIVGKRNILRLNKRLSQLRAGEEAERIPNSSSSSARRSGSERSRRQTTKFQNRVLTQVVKDKKRWAIEEEAKTNSVMRKGRDVKATAPNKRPKPRAAFRRPLKPHAAQLSTKTRIEPESAALSLGISGLSFQTFDRRQ
jgi:hypothetical protein